MKELQTATSGITTKPIDYCRTELIGDYDLEKLTYTFAPSGAGALDRGYMRQPVFVKHYFFYLDDAEFGESFIKVYTYAPYSLKIYVNGHE